VVDRLAPQCFVRWRDAPRTRARHSRRVCVAGDTEVWLFGSQSSAHLHGNNSQ
jgi:hypothetical protein